MNIKPCKHCGKTNHFTYQCHLHKTKRQTEYEMWRDKIAKPYLDKTYGRICNECKGVRCGNANLDVDHIKNRGSHQKLKMDINNVQYLGRYPCHYEKTNRI